MNNEIKDFYLNISSNGNPTYDDVINNGYDWLEHCHTWCQRAFPNYEKGELVPNSPVLDDETLKFLKSTCEIKIYKLVHRYMKHYSMLDNTKLLHNNRRITRLLKFLTMLEYNDLVDTCFGYFNNMLSVFKQSSVDALDYDSNKITILYWLDAMNYKTHDDNELIRN